MNTAEFCSDSQFSLNLWRLDFSFFLFFLWLISFWFALSLRENPLAQAHNLYSYIVWPFWYFSGKTEVFTSTFHLQDSNSKLTPLWWAAAEISAQLSSDSSILYFLCFLETCPNMCNSGVSQVFEGNLCISSYEALSLLGFWKRFLLGFSPKPISWLPRKIRLCFPDWVLASLHQKKWRVPLEKKSYKLESNPVWFLFYELNPLPASAFF